MFEQNSGSHLRIKRFTNEEFDRILLCDEGRGTVQCTKVFAAMYEGILEPTYWNPQR